MKKKFFLVIFIALLFQNLSNAVNVEDGFWDGTWTYSYEGGTTYGGSGIYGTYELIIDGSFCTITGEGYQLFCGINCTGVESEYEYQIFYLSTMDDYSSCGFESNNKPIVTLRFVSDGIIVTDSDLLFSEEENGTVCFIKN